jgi:hypothetical protein
MQTKTFMQSRLKTFSTAPLRTLLYVVATVAITEILIQGGTMATVAVLLLALFLGVFSVLARK